MHIKHLDGGHFFQNAARCESGSGLLELKPEGDMQAIGEEANEDVRFDATLFEPIHAVIGHISRRSPNFFETFGRNLRLSFPLLRRRLLRPLIAQQHAKSA